MSNNFKKAIKIANKYHKWQLRKDGTLYIDHPLRVAKLLENYWFPEEVLISAVLHDICEDTTINSININKLFWTRVWFIINALSKNKKPKKNLKLKKEFKDKAKSKKISNLENYNTFEEYIDFRFHLYINRLYTWIIAEPRIFFIKISDQIDNLSDMKPFTTEKKLRKIEEVEKYFLPIYEKCNKIYNFDSKYIKLHEEFILLLKEIVKNAKLNINN